MAHRKVILFGGTFDPIHLGHTSVAEHAAKVIGAEQIIFVPAKQSPLKKLLPKAKDNARIEMITLAITNKEKCGLSEYELKKNQPSYTLETVRYFQKDLPGSPSLYWLIGADCIDELPRWFGIDELIDECNVCVMHRAGFETPNFENLADIFDKTRIRKLQQNVIKTPLVDISSVEIRRRLTAGEDVNDMLHPAVADYIRRHNLYR